MEFSVRLPEDHKKVLVDAPEDTAPVVRNDLTTSNPRAVSNPRLLRQIRETQEQQQAQIKYLYDGLMQLANATGVNQGVFGGVLPVGGFGVGTGTGNGQCFGAIGFDSNGNPVIGFSADGTAIGVLSFNADGVPILGETTLVTPVNNGGAGSPTDLNGDGVPDEAPQNPPEGNPAEVGDPFPDNPAPVTEPPDKALRGRTPRGGAATRPGAPAQPPTATPATPQSRRSSR
jgi:hypothetical protein